MTEILQKKTCSAMPAPLFKRGGHFVARFLHFCCRWRKKRAARGGFTRSEALGLPGAGYGLAGGVLWGFEINFQRASGCSLAPRARSSAPMAFAAGVFCIP